MSEGRVERALLVITPALAVTAVGLGLFVGAGEAMRAGIVDGAPRSAAGRPYAWQLTVFDEDLGVREPAPHVPVEVTAIARGATTVWRGTTNGDGVAEVTLDLPSLPDRIAMRSGGASLGEGGVAPPPALEPPRPSSAWARFARREGDIVLDVAVTGQRAASSFPVGIWIRAKAGVDGAPVAGVVIEPEVDASFTPAASRVVSDAMGWAHLTATPLGFSVPLVLHATSPAGTHGLWAGGLFVSPGASGLGMRERYAPGEPIAIDVTAPNTRTSAYLEIDDASGRAWADAVDLPPADANAPSRVTVHAPGLPAGLYVAVVAGSGTGATTLGPGTLARPFFVAPGAAASLTLGTDPEACAKPGDVRLVERAASACLAVVAPSPVARWLALDGFASKRTEDARQRARGLRVALGAVLLAVLLEAVLVLRRVAAARTHLAAAEADGRAAPGTLLGRASTVVVGLLVALLGFALLGAMLLRMS